MSDLSNISDIMRELVVLSKEAATIIQHQADEIATLKRRVEELEKKQREYCENK